LFREAVMRSRRFRNMPFWIFAPALLAGCTCPPEIPTAKVDVSGTYSYSGDSIFLLRGTITFEQEEDVVRVTGVTYENSRDRDLVGESVLRGNRLPITLVPKNGDTDYRADVTFLFSDDGETFCVEFSDTNGDAGGMGTYQGTKVNIEN
jgi:hypothetical protein